MGVSHSQGNKKLDKAEILEMTIEYIQRLHQGGAGGGRGSGQIDLALGQKEWATDLTTWVIQNKILHTGESTPSSLLHLSLVCTLLQGPTHWRTSARHSYCICRVLGQEAGLFPQPRRCSSTRCVNVSHTMRYDGSACFRWQVERRIHCYGNSCSWRTRCLCCSS